MAKIAIVDLCFNWPPLGGSWVDVKNVAERLRDRGHEPVLFVPRLDYGFPRGRIDGEPSFPVRRVPFSRFSYNLLTAPARLRREVESFGPDHVFITDGYFLKPYLIHALRRFEPVVRFYAYEIFCIQNNRFRDGKNCRSDLLEKGPSPCADCRRSLHPLLPGFIKLLKNVPQYFVFHEYLMSLAFLPLYPALAGKYLGEARRIIVYNSIQKGLVERYNPRVTMVPSGVDTELFSPRTGDTTGPFTIGLAGRYYEEGKGLDTALRACRMLHSEGWKFRVLVASPREIDARDDFIRYCGWYDRGKLPDFYRGCDLVVVPSIWEEPFGITAVEALSCGIPVVASASGALPTIVEEGKSGYLYPRGDAGELAKRLRNFLESPDLAARMGAAARERAVTSFGWDGIITEHYLPLFEDRNK